MGRGVNIVMKVEWIDLVTSSQLLQRVANDVAVLEHIRFHESPTSSAE